MLWRLGMAGASVRNRMKPRGWDVDGGRIGAADIDRTLYGTTRNTPSFGMCTRAVDTEMSVNATGHLATLGRNVAFAEAGGTCAWDKDSRAHGHS